MYNSKLFSINDNSLKVLRCNPEMHLHQIILKSLENSTVAAVATIPIGWSDELILGEGFLEPLVLFVLEYSCKGHYKCPLSHQIFEKLGMGLVPIQD